MGAIWEINFSTSNDSSKLEVYFTDEARQRFRELQTVPDYNTQLSFVSIVGGRGVGKSTVASLLSGNSSLFDVSLYSNRIAHPISCLTKDHGFQPCCRNSLFTISKRISTSRNWQSMPTQQVIGVYTQTLSFSCIHLSPTAHSRFGH